MPHVVIEGPVSPEDIWLGFKPLDAVEGGTRFKVLEAYLRHDKTEALARALTVERGFTKNFYIRFTQHGDRMTIGLEPLASPERSDGVKRLIGLCAWLVLQAEPRCTIVSTNIGELVRGTDPAAQG